MGATDTPPTVAVRPFQVLGGNPDQRYLARGLTSELTTHLSRLSGLTVITTSIVPGMPDDDTESSTQGRFQIWGAVQRTGGRIGVEVRLVETSTGRQLWTERYDRPLGDLFAIQSEIGARLAETLSVQVPEAERRRLAHRFSRSVEAYDLFLRARVALLTRGRAYFFLDDLEQAQINLREAISRNPASLEARIYLAAVLESNGDREGAQWEAEEVRAIESDFSTRNWLGSYPMTDLRQREQLLSLLDELGL